MVSNAILFSPQIPLGKWFNLPNHWDLQPKTWNNLTCAYCPTASGSTTTKQPLIAEVYAGDPSTLSAEAATGRVQVRWGDLGFFVHRRSGKPMWLWWFLVLIPKMSQGSPPGAKLIQIFWDETQQKWGFWTSLHNRCEVSYECKKQPHHLGFILGCNQHWIQNPVLKMYPSIHPGEDLTKGPQNALVQSWTL